MISSYERADDIIALMNYSLKHDPSRSLGENHRRAHMCVSFVNRTLDRICRTENRHE